ncbi:MAG: carboxypeptidase-like regulatory domain-containing protein [Pseudomonadota bacterium]
MFVRIGSFAAATALLACLPLSAQAQSDPFALLFGEEEGIDAGDSDQAGADDIRFVGMRVSGLKLKAQLTAYQREEGLCIVAKDIVKTLNAPITIEDGVATGWYMRPEEQLTLSFIDETLRPHGMPSISISGYVFDTPDGWCALPEVWSSIFPAEITYDPGTLTLNMEPFETLPFIARLEREALRERLEAREKSDGPNYRQIENPYTWVSFPTADIAVDIKASSEGELTVDGSFELAGDIFMTTAHIRSARTRDGDRTFRASFDRVFNPPSDSLLPRQLQFGDVSGLFQPLIRRSNGGRGLRITNAPAYLTDVFDMTEIRGPLREGWEAELHRDGQLIAFTTTPDAQGDYVFSEVEILPGHNRFTVKLFSPFGETEEREVILYAGRDMLPENEIRYDLALLEEGIALAGDTLGEPQGASGAVTLSYGLSRQASVQLDLAASEADGPSGAASMYLARGNTNGVLRLGIAGADEPAFESGVAHLFEEGSSVNVRYTFRPDGMRFDDTRHDLRADYNTSLPIGRWGLPFRARGEWQRTSSGADLLSLSGRISGNIQGWRWTHNSGFAHQSSDNGPARSDLNGEFAASRRYAGMRIRAGARYKVLPSAEIQSLDLALQRRMNRGSFAQLNTSYDVSTGGSFLGGTYGGQVGPLTLSANGRLDGSGSWTAGLRLSTALFYDDTRKRYRTATSGLTRSGAVQLNVYDDLDGDGTFSNGDVPMTGTSFIVEQSIRAEETDQSGSVVMSGISSHRPVNVELSLGSLDDPFLQPLEPGIGVTVRPGQVISADVPLTMSGDAEATVILIRGDARMPVAGVVVEAVNAAGRVIGSAMTEYDGYVYLDGLPVGDLTLRVSEDALKAAGGKADSVNITLTRDEPSAFGAQIEILVGDED